MLVRFILATKALTDDTHSSLASSLVLLIQLGKNIRFVAVVITCRNIDPVHTKRRTEGLPLIVTKVLNRVGAHPVLSSAAFLQCVGSGCCKPETSRCSEGEVRAAGCALSEPAAAVQQFENLKQHILIF